MAKDATPGVVARGRMSGPQSSARCIGGASKARLPSHQTAVRAYSPSAPGPPQCRPNALGAGRGPLVLRASCEGSTGGSSSSSGLWPRLFGVLAPGVRLPFAPGEPLPGSVVSLAELSRHRSLAVFFYGGVVSRGDGEGVGLEGARVEGWREHESELAELGYGVVGVSSQSSEVQAQFALDRMVSSFTFLSDGELLLANELGLPTGRGRDGERVYEPLTMLVRDGRISWVFYPLERPEFDATIVTMRIRGLYA